MSTAADLRGEGSPGLEGRAALLAVLLAVPWLGYQLWRLILQARPDGPVDLRLRWRETRSWFAGEHVYAVFDDSVYPPASYLLLGPGLSWPDFQQARWLWAAVCLASLAFALRELARAASGAGASTARFLACAALGTYPAGATLGNGQLGLVVLALLLALMRCLERPPSIGRDLLAAGLLLAALVKPTLAGPFFWLLLARGGPRAALLCAGGYAAVTWLACAWQADGVLDLMRQWMERARGGADYGARKGEGAIRVVVEQPVRLVHVNLHSLLASVGASSASFLATAGVLLAGGAFVLLRRRAAPWTLFGAVAVLTRFLTYHGWYDDVVLLLSLAALVRLAHGLDPAGPRLRRAAAATAAAQFVLMLAPGGVYSRPLALANAYVVLLTVTLLAGGAILALACSSVPAFRGVAPARAGGR